MREYTEPTPIDLQAFSTGRILKESWEICTKYFGALVMPMFLMLVPGVLIVMFIPGKPGESLDNLVSGILLPIAVMGLNRSILMLKSEGLTPTLGQTFSAGSDYWWRGIKINIVTGLYGFVLGISIVLMIIPGALVVDTEALWGGILLAAGIVGSIWTLVWFCAHACLAMPAMADGRTSAFKSFEAGWELAKRNQSSTRPLFLAIAGISIGVLLILIGTAGLAIGLEICTEEVAIGLMMIPLFLSYTFGIAYFYIAVNLAYQALKPAPTEENQLPGAN